MPGDRVAALAISPDVRWVAVSIDHDVLVVNAETLEPRWREASDPDLDGPVAWTSAGDVACVDDQGEVVVRAGDDGRVLHRLGVRFGRDGCLATSRETSLVAVGHRSTVSVYDLRRGAALAWTATRREFGVSEVKFTPDDGLVVLDAWSLRRIGPDGKDEHLGSVDASGTHRALAVSWDGTRVACAYQPEPNKSWVQLYGRPSLDFVAAEATMVTAGVHVTAVAFTPAGDHVVAGGKKGRLGVHAVAKPESAVLLPVGEGDVTALTVGRNHVIVADTIKGLQALRWR